jgi:hypothetical protein
LIEQGHATADQLPGALFAVEPENFWELLARRKRLEMCIGVRRDVSETNPEISFVVASDSVLMGELLNGVTTLGGTAKLRKSDSTPTSSMPDATPQPEHLKQSLVWSPGQASNEEVIHRAEMVYKEFSESKGDKAFVAVGSTKSNPVVEIVLSRAFNCNQFESQHDVEKATDRSIPFFLRYRDHDPHPESCVGGMQLSRSEKDLGPGIYMETANGTWKCFGSNSPKEEVAFVFYVHRESQGRLEMVLGGFSGRATRLLARALATRAEDFWPPVYETQGIQIGGFVVQFSLPSTKKEVDILRTDLVATTEVTAIPKEAFERRMAK